MALLTPNATYKINGLTVNEKIIPNGTRWKDSTKAKKAGFGANSLYKSEKLLTNNTGKVLSVTIHNTNDLDNVYDDAEQYTRATYNENMLSARVHFYVDDVAAWQNLRAGTGMCAADALGSAEVSWHAGDGSTNGGGNMTSLSIEVIMGDTTAHDEKAKDNAARLAAWLLWRHGLTIDNLVTHTYWVNKSAGKSIADIDKQCTTLVPGEKWCPSYIFGSTNAATALTNWKKFKALVKKYLDGITQPSAKPTEPAKTLYRVQTGAFSNKANAATLEAKLKAAGFDTYIVQNGGYYKVQVGAYSVKANAEAMEKKLKAAGYSTYITTESGSAVSAGVPVKTVDEIAREVIAGKWGSGAARKNKLEAAGYDYSAVQKRVNELLK